MEPKDNSQTTPTETPDLDQMISNSIPLYTPEMDTGDFPGSPADPQTHEPGPPPSSHDPEKGPEIQPQPDAAHGTPPPAQHGDDAGAAETPPPDKAGDDADVTGSPQPDEKQFPPWYRFDGDYHKAETGYRNLRGQITKAEQKNADLAKELAELKERAALEQHKKEERTAVFEFAKERRKKVLAEKNKLDPEADDYDDRVAEIEAQAEIDIREFRYEQPAPAGEGTGGTSPGQGSQPPDKAGDNAAYPPQSDISDLSFSEQEALQAEIDKILPEFGLSADDPVFAGFAARADRTMDFTDQVSWALGMTRDYMAREMAATEKIDPADPVLVHYINQQPIKDTATGNMIPIAVQITRALDKTKKYKAAQRAKTLQETGAPIRRTATTGPTPTKPQDVKPISLGEALDKAQDKLVI